MTPTQIEAFATELTALELAGIPAETVQVTEDDELCIDGRTYLAVDVWDTEVTYTAWDADGPIAQGGDLDEVAAEIALARRYAA